MSHLEKMMNDMEHPVGDLLDWSNDEKDMGIACYLTDDSELSQSVYLDERITGALLDRYDEQQPANLMEITKAVAAKKLTKEQAYDCIMHLLYDEFEADLSVEIDHYNEA